jgi:hypothetical protein
MFIQTPHLICLLVHHNVLGGRLTDFVAEHLVGPAHITAWELQQRCPRQIEAAATHRVTKDDHVEKTQIEAAATHTREKTQIEAAATHRVTKDDHALKKLAGPAHITPHLRKQHHPQVVRHVTACQ